MKDWKLWPHDECTNCGNNVEVFSECEERNDKNGLTYAMDGDEIRCVEKCGFTSHIEVDYSKDDPTAHMNWEGNIEELEDTLVTEERPCSDCKHHKRDMHGSFCSKKLMSVIPELKVAYHRNEGTCFE